MIVVCQGAEAVKAAAALKKRAEKAEEEVEAAKDKEQLMVRGVDPSLCLYETTGSSVVRH
jgi:hypothetical protein